MKWRNVLKNIFLLSIPSMILVVLLLEFFVFRFILPANQIPDIIFDAEYLVKRFDRNGPKSGQFTIGKWASNREQWQLNNYGWMSHIDYDTIKSRPRIAVIGDSFVMPAVINTQSGFSQQLHEMMKDSLDVYSFGVGSTPLSNYLQMAHLVVDRFDPDMLIVNVVYNDFSKSLDQFTKDKFWRYRIEEDSTITVLKPNTSNIPPISRLQKSAIFRYLRTNLGIQYLGLSNSKAKATYEENVSKQEVKEARNDIRKVTHHILNQFKMAFPDKRILFLMDAPREKIYEGHLEKSKVIWMNQLLADACLENDLEFIDLTSYFQEDYRINNKRFEFKWDRHWNAYGHRLVAEVLYNYLRTPLIKHDE